MTLNEVIDFISTADADTAAAIEQAVNEGRVKPLASIVDRRVDKALKAQKRNLTESLGGDEIEILARLDRIEKAADERARKAELAAHLKVRCSEAGVPFTVLADIPFESAVDIDTKVMELAHAIQDRDRADMNAKMANGYKPSHAGDATDYHRPASSYSLAEMNNLTDIELAELGK